MKISVALALFLLVGCKSRQEIIREYVSAHHCQMYQYRPPMKEFDNLDARIEERQGVSYFACDADGDLARTNVFVYDVDGKPWRPK